MSLRLHEDMSVQRHRPHELARARSYFDDMSLIIFRGNVNQIQEAVLRSSLLNCLLPAGGARGEGACRIGFHMARASSVVGHI